MKVLLLSASTGNGHMSAAWAVESVLKERGHEAKTVDVLDHTGRAFRGWYRGGYEVLVRRKPQLWGHLYKSSDKKRFNYWFQTGLDVAFVSKMGRFLAHERPDWVLCTHSLPQPVLSRWRTRLSFRMGIVVTDLYPQLMWLRGRPDWFFVPGEWSKTILEQRSSHAEGRISVTGIPVDPRFGERQNRGEAKAAVGLLPDKPLVLVSSGGIGGGPIGQVVAELGARQDCNFIVVCGRSEAAFRAASSAACPNVRVEAHVSTDQMISFMHAADLIVAKPGGITTFEALASGLPFLVYDPFLIPGQEEKNAEFLVESGIGVRASNPVSLLHTLGGLIDAPDRLAEMSAQALAHAKPHAAREIVERLEQL